MGRRRKARELALKILYAYDVKGSSDIKECINGFGAYILVVQKILRNMQDY